MLLHIFSDGKRRIMIFSDSDVPNSQIKTLAHQYGLDVPGEMRRIKLSAKLAQQIGEYVEIDTPYQ